MPSAAPANSVFQRAKATDCLQARIDANVGGQQLDLTQWIFESLTVRPGSRVLELCCGTGAQSCAILDLVGPDGHLVALDASAEAVASVREKCKPEHQGRLTALQGELDNIPAALASAGVQGEFDLIFCAYGLYYSSDASATLDVCLKMLRPGGAIAVVGPHGRNNWPLYQLLENAGVTIPPVVYEGSASFMRDVVVKWAEASVLKVDIRMVDNAVTWKSGDRVLDYWRNSTFYEASREAAVSAMLEQHFSTHGSFTNVKCIMLAIMTHAR